MLDPIADSQCSFTSKTMTEDFCTKTLSIADLLSKKISTNGAISSSVPITKGVIKKYNYNDKYDQILLDPDADANKAALEALDGTPTYTASDGTCDNFALEYHLRI